MGFWELRIIYGKGRGDTMGMEEDRGAKGFVCFFPKQKKGKRDVSIEV